jgi:hypothetical protein
MPEASPLSADHRQHPRRVRGRLAVAGPAHGRASGIARGIGLGLALVLARVAAGCLPTSIRTSASPDASTGTPTPTFAPATPSPTPGPPTPTPGPSFATYKVVRGDTLTSIARHFHTSPRSLAYWNRDRYPTLDPESSKYQPDNLKAGWVLRVMPNAEYSPPPDDGETGIDSTPSPPDDATDAPSPDGSAGTSPGASAGG